MAHTSPCGLEWVEVLRYPESATVAELDHCIGQPVISRMQLWLLDCPVGVLAIIWPSVCWSPLKSVWVARGLLMLPDRQATLQPSLPWPKAKLLLPHCFAMTSLS